jgi:hypothetical protein
VDNHEFTYNSLILAQDADYVWREVQYALSRQEPFRLNYRIRCADQSIKHVWEKGVGIYADTREVLGIEGRFSSVIPARTRGVERRFAVWSSAFRRRSFGVTCGPTQIARGNGMSSIIKPIGAADTNQAAAALCELWPKYSPAEITSRIDRCFAPMATI